MMALSEIFAAASVHERMALCGMDDDVLLLLLGGLPPQQMARAACTCRQLRDLLCHTLREEKAAAGAALMRELNLAEWSPPERHRNLHFDQCAAGTMDLIAPHLPTNLEGLSLRACDALGDDGLVALLERTPRGGFDALQSLNINDTAISARGVRALANLAHAGGLPSLQYLSMTHNQLDDEAAAALAHAMSALPELNTLHASDNLMGNYGVLAIVNAAARHPTLYAMRLHNNMHTALNVRVDSVSRALRAEGRRPGNQILMRGGMHIVPDRLAQAMANCATTRGSDWIRRERLETLRRAR